MNAIKHRFVGLCLPPLLLCLLDASLTLMGQSPEYWSGNYAAVNEASPTMNHLLQMHPLVFVAGLLIWTAVFVSVLFLLPDTLALGISIALTFGHTAGSATWLYWRYHYGYQLCNGLFLLTAAVLAVAIRHGWQAIPRERYLLPFSPVVRWLMVLAIIALAVYMYLWPRHAYLE
jgi:hypothetical protein